MKEKPCFQQYAFADIVSDPWHYNVSLYMFTNLMDKLGRSRLFPQCILITGKFIIKPAKNGIIRRPLRKAGQPGL